MTTLASAEAGHSNLSKAPAILAKAPWSDTSESGLRITNVRTFMTAPQGVPYLIVRIETSEPGLYGLGCASDPQRTLAVRSVVDDYYTPALIGRDPADIEDIHRLLLNSGYWRGGSIQGNALAAIDVALWDLKGKAAAMPLYSLLGGRARTHAETYTHVHGNTAAEIVDEIEKLRDDGYRHFRVQVTVPGSDTYGTTSTGVFGHSSDLRDGTWDALSYLTYVPTVLCGVRELIGDGVELLHDAHQRLSIAQARQFAQAVEPARLFFLEDVLAPEDSEWFPQLRALTTTPLAVGEVFGDIHQYLRLIETRSIDFIRIRIPTLGGITPVRKLVAAAELFGIRTAPHGPGDVSPVAQAANLALDISAPNFGIQEAAIFRDETLDVFPGTFVPQHGVLVPSQIPGLGVDFDERLAARFSAPAPLEHDRWAMLRNTDGSVQRP
ncbi:MAG: Mandelate racemase/muconate lactonizing protein [Subtercola sp.]|jgi:mannonate dehydratase|nr:Mandelate racemase/muconate lactonizing protein [Subtercola sp.]